MPRVEWVGSASTTSCGDGVPERYDGGVLLLVRTPQLSILARPRNKDDEVIARPASSGALPQQLAQLRRLALLSQRINIGLPGANLRRGVRQREP